MALHRFIDADEGFYLLASRLVLLRKKPYVDFFYDQAPLLPYIYALWMRFFGVTWTAARLLSALLTALLGTLLAEDVFRWTRSWITVISASVLFAISGLIFAWFPVAKTPSLSGLFLFSAYLLTSRLPAKPHRLSLAASGLLFALSVDTRSYLILAGPVFVWWISQNSGEYNRLSSTLWFLGGFSAGILPCAYFLVLWPDRFLFNNIGFHSIRSDGGGLVGMWREKIAALLQTFLGGPESNGIQTSILFFVSLGFLSSFHQRVYPPRLAFQIAVVVGLASLLPTPVHPQYFCLCIPFLLLSAVCIVHDLIHDLESWGGKLMAGVACAVVATVYLAASLHDIRRYLVTGDGVAGVELSSEKEDWRLQRVREVSQAIDRVALPGEPVASSWSGYVFQTKATPFPGFEADFNISVADKVTAEQRARYHMLSPAEIEADFAMHRPRIIVLRDDSAAAAKGGSIWHKILRMEGDFRASLQEHGYRLRASIGKTSIYVYPTELVGASK